MTTPPALNHLMGAYLNEDWPADYTDEWDALEAFIREARSSAPRLPNEIARLLIECPTEQELRTFFIGIASAYGPDPEEGGYRGWLTEVARRVTVATESNTP